MVGHPGAMAPLGGSPIMCGNLWCSTAAQAWGVGGWEAGGRVWVHSRLPGRVVGHPDAMAPHGGSPIMTEDLVGTTAQIWGGMREWGG